MTTGVYNQAGRVSAVRTPRQLDPYCIETRCRPGDSAMLQMIRNGMDEHYSGTEETLLQRLVHDVLGQPTADWEGEWRIRHAYTRFSGAPDPPAAVEPGGSEL